ncbi:MAG: hypothetical protein EBW74_11295 [Betaproteobacteria bacterium]|nr:hypothetical protein [Betaproteobacteria bacterium]
MRIGFCKIIGVQGHHPTATEHPLKNKIERLGACKRIAVDTQGLAVRKNPSQQGLVNDRKQPGPVLGMPCNKTNVGDVANFDEEVKESWIEFHDLEEHDLNRFDVDEFVDWHNENRVTQIERIFLEVI